MRLLTRKLKLFSKKIACRSKIHYKTIKLKSKPYLDLIRFQNQIGTYLLFFPCAWSTAIATSQSELPDLKLLAVFAVGAFVMRNSGCIVNDLWDKEIDRKVDRTKNRPLASGRIGKGKAVAFLMANMTLGLGVLSQLNLKTALLSFGSVPLFMLYPYMKRVTYWPQLFLGLAFNYGALLGMLQVTGNMHWEVCLPLYITGIFHTLIYDTIYAFQDIKDDKKIGVKSTAIRLQSNIKPFLSAFALSVSCGLYTVGHFSGLGSIYYLISVLGGTSHLSLQIWNVDVKDRESCRKMFISNKWFGLIVLSGIVLDRINLS